jgi:hypothetical protein
MYKKAVKNGGVAVHGGTLQTCPDAVAFATFE